MVHFLSFYLLAVALLTWSFIKAQECVVPKCCSPNHTIPESGKDCQNSSLKFVPDFWNGSEPLLTTEVEILNIIVGDPCQYGKYRLEPEEDSSDEFHIMCNGSLLVPFQSNQLYGLSHYCLESFLTKDKQQTVTLPLLCFPPPLSPPTVFEKAAMAVYPVGLLISVPFLILTMMVFLGIPELRDTQGKSLSCHCLSLAVAYLTLATVMLFGDRFFQTLCVILAFVIQFAFISCFFWLNILCIDTWWRLTRKPCWSSHQEHIMFIWYSLYAWTIPLAIVVVTMVMELSPIVPDAYLKPMFGVLRCWFQNREAAFPYFYAPIGLLLLVDICLFCMSISSVRLALEQRVEEEMGLNTGQDLCVYNKASKRVEMFKKSLILFLVMGLSWTLELLSYFIGGPVEIWILTDTLNTLQGVIIYFVFIVTVPRVKHMASNRLAPVCGCPLQLAPE